MSRIRGESRKYKKTAEFPLPSNRKKKKEKRETNPCSSQKSACAQSKAATGSYERLEPNGTGAPSARSRRAGREPRTQTHTERKSGNAERTRKYGFMSFKKKSDNSENLPSGLNDQSELSCFGKTRDDVDRLGLLCTRVLISY